MFFEYYKEIEIFVDLVKHRSVESLIAEKNCSKNLIWHALDKLERVFQTKLINRLKTGIELTVEGRLLYHSFFLSFDQLSVSTPKPVITILASPFVTSTFIKDHHALLNELKSTVKIKLLSLTNSLQTLSPINKFYPSYHSLYACDLILCNDFGDVLNKIYSEINENIFIRAMQMSIPKKAYCSQTYYAKHVKTTNCLTTNLSFASFQHEKCIYLYDKNFNQVSQPPFIKVLQSETYPPLLSFIKSDMGIASLPVAFPQIAQYEFKDVFPENYTGIEHAAVYRHKQETPEVKQVLDLILNAINTKIAHFIP